VPLEMFRIAWAKIGAIGRMRIFSAARTASVGRIVSVITMLVIFDAAMRSTAGPDSTPWLM
jgi:hypothetical protein